MKKIKFSNPVQRINESITNEVNHRLEQLESQPNSAFMYCRLAGYIDALIDTKAITKDENTIIQDRMYAARIAPSKESREQRTA